MKHLTSIGLALLVAASALALPLPIQHGVLTGPLNANGQAVTNVGTLTFADGTTQSTAGGGGGVPAGFTGTVTNLTETVVTTAGPNLMPDGSSYSGTPCGLYGVILPFYLQPNTSYLVILGPNELGPPPVPGGPNYPGFYLLDGNCYSQGQMSATNVLNFSSPQNPYTIGFGDPPGGVSLATFTIQQITTNVVQSFNVTTYSNGVVQTNNGVGGAYNPPAAPAGVQYGGPMMFDYAYGCTNILSDGVGDLLLQDGGQLFVNNNDSQGFGYFPGDMSYLWNGSSMTVIGSGSIQCVGGGCYGYSGPLMDSSTSQGGSGQMMVSNGDGTWLWGGGNNFFAPGCVGSANYAAGGNSVFCPNCTGVTDNGGSCFFGPSDNTLNTSCGYTFFGANCSGINEDGGFSFFAGDDSGIADEGGNAFYGPGCNTIQDYGPGFDFFAGNCSTITIYGGHNLFSPDCQYITEGGHDCFYGSGCAQITGNGVGYSFYGPGCAEVVNGGSGSFFGPNCFNVSAGGGGSTFYCGGGYNDSDSGSDCFYGPGCKDITSSSAYGAYFGVTSGGTIANCTGVLVVGDNSTAVNLANETSLVVAGSYQLGVGTNNVRLKTDGHRIIPTVPLALTNGVVTVEGTTFYPHTVAGALVWTTNPAHD